MTDADGTISIFVDGGRDLTWEERARWGQCPVCVAPAGTDCYASVGFQLGHRLDGRVMKDGEGVHLARIRNAPTRVWVEAG